jgi:hypothetical protein
MSHLAKADRAYSWYLMVCYFSRFSRRALSVRPIIINTLLSVFFRLVEIRLQQ